MAAPTGRDGSAELVCQAALPGQGFMGQGSGLASIHAEGRLHAGMYCSYRISMLDIRLCQKCYSSN